MGKIVMPKNSTLLNEIEAVLKIYYEAGGWLANDEYIPQLKAIIGDDQYSSSYTKKAQITSYFGFTESKDIHGIDEQKQYSSHLLHDERVAAFILFMTNSCFRYIINHPVFLMGFQRGRVCILVP